MTNKFLGGEKPSKINYGITADKIVLEFDRPLSNLMMTPAQVDEMIAGLQTAKNALAARKPS